MIEVLVTDVTEISVIPSDSNTFKFSVSNFIPFIVGVIVFSAVIKALANPEGSIVQFLSI